MKISAALLLLVVLFVYLAYDPLIEAPRLKEQTQEDLKITFSESPKLLETETFGWAEEGGDRSLLKLSPSDCTTVVNILGDLEKPEAEANYMRMFNAEGLNPPRVRSKYWSNTHGDTKLYVLAPSACVLFREAFFE